MAITLWDPTVLVILYDLIVSCKPIWDTPRIIHRILGGFHTILQKLTKRLWHYLFKLVRAQTFTSVQNENLSRLSIGGFDVQILL